ncbi:ABC transporter permease [Streptomyces sp. NPDC057682]|uniref:ABC transporter permease n=1 Tax=Streptomyces sp. NPDC057682 TaxID=3346210 RepID=UPI0036B59C63
MTTALVTPTAPLTARGGGFTGLLRAEWIKLTSVRSTLWTLALMTATAVGVSVLISAITAAQWKDSSAADRQGIVEDPVGTIFGALGLAELVICVLGVLVVTSEYSTGTIRASVLAVPRRSPMLVAKALVFAAMALVVGEIASFASFFSGAALLRDHVTVTLDDPGVLRAVAGTGLFLAAMSLVALGVGALVRHTAGAIAGVIGFVLVLSPLASTLPGTVGKHLSAYLPTNAGQLIVFAVPDPEAVLSPWQGLAVCALWGVALLTAAAVLLKRRDV